MTGKLTALLLGLGMISGGQSQRTQAVMSLCDLSKNYGAYRDKVVTVRGVYYFELRAACQQKCAAGPWPSFIDLVGAGGGVFDGLSKTEQEVEREAKEGKRVEIWVTAHGQLKTTVNRANPCDRHGWFPGYGHLGAYPAQLVVSSLSDIEVVENANSLYDYANMYHSPA